MHKKIFLSVFLLLILASATAFAEQITYKFINIEEFKQSQSQVVAVDVRSENSRSGSRASLPGEVWINPQSGQALQDFVMYSDKSATYVIFCSCPDDNYSIRTAQILTKNGFNNVSVLKNGWDAIVESGMKTIPFREE